MASCVSCGRELPSSHRYKTCSMCYGDPDHGTDGFYRQMLEEDARRQEEHEQERREEEENADGR